MMRSIAIVAFLVLLAGACLAQYGPVVAPLPRHFHIDSAVADSTYNFDFTIYSGVNTMGAKILTFRPTADFDVDFGYDYYYSSAPSGVSEPDTTGKIPSGRDTILSGEFFIISVSTSTAGASLEVWGEY